MMDVKKPERWDNTIDTADDPYAQGSEMTEGKRFRAELVSALTWTGLLAMGSSPGTPSSSPGKAVRIIGGLLMRCAPRLACFDFVSSHCLIECALDSRTANSGRSGSRC
eukprot:COSAG02_NODE_3058_length_7451_cov_47.724701_3_plen_109_part_00